MQYLGDFALESTFDLKFTTAAAATGAPTTLAGTPVISAYPGNSTTQLTAGITLSVDFDGVTGLHNCRVVGTAANGYATATNYALVITTGTVGGTSAVGYVVGHFSIEARSSLRPTVAGRTFDVSATGEGGVDWGNVGSPTTSNALSGTSIAANQSANVVQWNGTNVATPDTAGFAKVTVKSGTGTGELSLASGVVAANATSINSVAAAAARLALSAGQMIPGTVATAGFTPTSTEFECSDITEATTSHYNNRAWLWTTGALAGQAALVSAYSLIGGRGHFTVTTMTEAPANTDTGLLI